MLTGMTLLVCIFYRADYDPGELFPTWRSSRLKTGFQHMLHILAG